MYTSFYVGCPKIVTRIRTCAYTFGKIFTGIYFTDTYFIIVVMTLRIGHLILTTWKNRHLVLTTWKNRHLLFGRPSLVRFAQVHQFYYAGLVRRGAVLKTGEICPKSINFITQASLEGGWY